MLENPDKQSDKPDFSPDWRDEGDFSDMLSESRILLPGSQMLTAFLILLPFNGAFEDIVHSEKIVFLATFFFALTSLVLLSAPAIQHRLMRPLIDRARFKRIASKQIVLGALALALAFILGSNLVISEVFGPEAGIIAGGTVAILILCVWWALPLYWRRTQRF